MPWSASRRFTPDAGWTEGDGGVGHGWFFLGACGYCGHLMFDVAGVSQCYPLVFTEDFEWSMVSYLSFSGEKMHLTLNAMLWRHGDPWPPTGGSRWWFSFCAWTDVMRIGQMKPQDLSWMMLQGQCRPLDTSLGDLSGCFQTENESTNEWAGHMKEPISGPLWCDPRMAKHTSLWFTHKIHD